MIKQAPFQLLEHGKLLCGKLFPRFVECWNWLFGSFVDMRGDADLDAQNGFITRDDSGSFPVFRLTNLDKLGSGESKSDNKDAFSIYNKDGTNITLTNCLYMIGGKLYTMGSTQGDVPYCCQITVSIDSVFYVEIKMSGFSRLADIKYCNSILSLVEKSREEDKFVIPLYQFVVNEEGDDCSVVRDLRNIPIVPTFEMS